ncbi:MAG: class I SAM-dependent methyltransferase [Myxococcaceae bacterium]
MAAHDSTTVNRDYYARMSPGQRDYWRKMAAARHRVEVITKSAAQLAPGSLIDLGCGNGVLLAALHQALPTTSFAGIDLVRAQVDANALSFPWARFLERDLQQPLEPSFPWEGQFDVATASEVIEHLDDPASLLRNARRVLKPGGRLVLSTQSGPVRETEQLVGHRRHFSSRQMRELFSNEGFVAERVWNTGFPFHDLSKWYANLDPEGSMQEFGEAAYGLKQNVVCAALRLAFKLNSEGRGAQLFAVARRPA